MVIADLMWQKGKPTTPEQNIDMDAFEAKKVVSDEIRALVEKEPAWKMCNACPNSGECCNGAPISIWPEEWEPIRKRLDSDSELKNYVLKRFSSGEKCYFYDAHASGCPIYDLRPLNCIWTPFVFFNGNGISGFLKSFDCDFVRLDPTRFFYPAQPGSAIYEAELSNEERHVYHTHYLLFQAMTGIRGMQQRNEELRPIDEYLRQLV